MRVFRARAREVRLDRPILMGILNVTPDSFSDGGDFSDPEAAARHIQRAADEGADILDIGGESTRPGSTPVGADEECARVLPALRIARDTLSLPLSVDTMKASVAARAVSVGADIINDVWGFQRDREMARVAADTGAGVVLMHNRDAADPSIDIMSDVRGFLSRSVEIALRAGMTEDRILLDPGVGFGKTPEQSAEVISHLGDLRRLGFPILLGASRKRFIGRLTGVEDPKARLAGTLAAHICGVLQGADVIRAHDVAAHREAFSVLAAVREQDRA
ncbi:dihydropteroate synthase [Terrihabitans rhizophilus]|uniref:Dihydropteroate synthase n=1 Tax=Terrihabitans rhizophilus TaxID=3092662 RepID=A0ABU4RNY8_9HYPH|nr:dihydropteroate synthase [Terrihabitans sp. PJ23]MDX6806537.1 dihydropteroate synthase [Terrihabitans sp. PJ23]